MRLLGLDLPVLYSIPPNILCGGTQNDKIIQVHISFVLGCLREENLKTKPKTRRSYSKQFVFRFRMYKNQYVQRSVSALLYLSPSPTPLQEDEWMSLSQLYIHVHIQFHIFIFTSTFGKLPFFTALIGAFPPNAFVFVFLISFCAFCVPHSAPRWMDSTQAAQEREISIPSFMRRRSKS